MSCWYLPENECSKGKQTEGHHHGGERVFYDAEGHCYLNYCGFDLLILSG
jgi:hypothetical protein